MRRRGLSDSQERQLLNTQAELTALTKHPSWPILESAILGKRERLERTLVANAMTKDGVSLEMQAYIRGFIHGMNYFALVPSNAEARLERYLRDHGITQEVTSGS